ncbi:hypothetical protein ACRC6Q_03615 [Planococcus sp. SE5232]|uniref:hypothetical protein n=1 Tax=unclassified Planococcus (in: firmicutes) TaxID=2662419 RepID=UPI003D6BE843
MVGVDRKTEAAVKPRQALEALPVMAFFAIAGKAEATRGAGCWSWTKKSGNGRSAPTGKRWLKGSLSHLFATKHRVLQEQ